MKVLITGGAGFIGSHLAESMLGAGHTVAVVDDLSTGSLANIAGLVGRSDFTFVQDDVRNEQTMHLLVKDCDVIFHLAAAVGVKLIVEEPVHTIKTNIHGTEVVLEVANKFRKKILLASTSEVYGKSVAVPFSEDDDTVSGSTRYSRWSYACSKAIDEFLGLAYYHEYGLDVVIARFFNTVGPRQTGQYGMVIPRFVQAALANEPLTIYGDGKQTRCFAHVRDTVRAVTHLMEHPEASGRVFNVGSTEEISIGTLAEKVIALTGSSSEMKYLTYEEAYGREFDDMLRRVPSLERIGGLIGYRPDYGIDEILRDVIAEFRG